MSSERTTPTVRIEKKTKDGRTVGFDYAKVVSRLVEVHKDNEKYDILTEWHVTDKGYVVMKATVKLERGTYTGHAMAKVTGQKELEKQETIAVGRALAFAGYLASGEIASYEEMVGYQLHAESESAEKMTDAEWAAVRKQWVEAFHMQDKTREVRKRRFEEWFHEMTGHHFADTEDDRQLTKTTLNAPAGSTPEIEAAVSKELTEEQNDAETSGD